MPQFIFSLGVALMASLMAGNWVPLRAEERVVHFFQVNALTGQAGSYGTRAIHGAELAAKHLNDAGGFTDTCGNTYTIKLSVWDMANSRALIGSRALAQLHLDREYRYNVVAQIPLEQPDEAPHTVPAK
jgi:hypothetical protein